MPEVADARPLGAWPKDAKIGVAQGGGLPAEIPVPGMCGSASGVASSFRSHLPYCDVAVEILEVMVALKRSGGVVFSHLQHGLTGAPWGQRSPWR